MSEEKRMILKPTIPASEIRRRIEEYCKPKLIETKYENGLKINVYEAR